MACAVTILPPATFGYSRGGSAPTFDRCQFAGRRAKAVSAETKLSFSDFGKMHLARREKQQIRRLDTPDWAMKDSTLRKAVLAYLDRRFYLRNTGGMTDAERLWQVDREARRRLPRLKRILDGHLLRYHAVAKNGASAETLRRLAIECQAADASIVMIEKGISALVIAAVFYYFRLGWTSVQIANALGVKPPMVRVWLYRIRHIADGQPMLHCRSRVKRSWSEWEIGRLRFMCELGLTHEQCAAALRIGISTVLLMCKAYFPQFSHSCCRRNRKWNARRVEALRSYLRGGLSLPDIARKMRCSYGSASFARRKYLPDLRMPERQRFDVRKRRRSTGFS